MATSGSGTGSGSSPGSGPPSKPSTQRTWRANCPGCGAPIEFLSAASTHAVCGYCNTSVVRDGESLKSLGKLSALFDDFSPLQLGALGKFQSQAFTVVGRLQYAWKQGTWNEWYCLFDAVPDNSADKPGAWLSEDNGQFVWMQQIQVGIALPTANQLRLSQNLQLGSQSFSVSAITEAKLMSGVGELPKIAPLNRPFQVVELRNAQGLVASLDYSEPAAPTVYLGSAVKLDALQLTGLRAQNEATIKGGRQFACPNCGASLSLKLEASKSLSCSSCNSLIDTSQGIGNEVVSALQLEPILPSIPLGTTGTLQGKDWQVVGYVSMVGKDLSMPDESFGWEEYLLYNQLEGFSFLADTSEGWSLSRTLSGSASMTSDRASATYLGANFRLKESYQTEVNYVAGEFYWRVERGAQTSVVEFIGKKASLVREQAGSEVTWSRSEPLDATQVLQAFGQSQCNTLHADVLPTSARRRPWATIIVLLLFFFILVSALGTCSRSDCDPNYQNCAASSGSSGTRGWGGSYGGGSSSGGGHK